MSRDARFEIEESQFEVADQRPIEVILAEHLAAGATIDGYEPPPRVQLRQYRSRG